MAASQPWFDYQPGQRIPDSVIFLRIGLAQYQQLILAAESGNRTALPIEIPRHAFHRHKNLKQVQIFLPAVSRIADWAFWQCLQLEQVEFVMKSKNEGSSLNSNVVEDGDNSPPSQLVTLGLGAFCECSRLHHVIGLEQARESLREIGGNCFLGCASLDFVGFLPSLTGLQSLGKFSFGHTAVVVVELSKAVNLTKLDVFTFRQCSALKTVHFPPNLLTIYMDAFHQCSALEDIHLPLQLQHLAHRVFLGCSELKAIVLPSSLQSIGRNLFHDCKNLVHVTLPSSTLPFLKRKPFDGSCTSLSSIQLPAQVPRLQWPLILEQFGKEDGIASVSGQIPNPKNRNSIVWNFLCQNMAQLFIENNATMSRRRPAPPA